MGCARKWGSGDVFVRVRLDFGGWIVMCFVEPFGVVVDFFFEIVLFGEMFVICVEKVVCFS